MDSLVVPLALWVSQDALTELPRYTHQLQAVHIEVLAQAVDHINARHLRQHPRLSLILTTRGLGLASQGMHMQPDWIAQLPRLKRASHKNELIARACQTESQPVIIDATAGLGHDGLLLAWLGARVTLVERHPVLFCLLQDAHAAASQHQLLAPVMQRITLVHADAADFLQQAIHAQARCTPPAVDVVYLDPMFPRLQSGAAKKQPKVKKEMQIVHQLLNLPGARAGQSGPVDWGEHLLPVAQQLARRVIVKRPRHALPLGNAMPQHQWQGDACRFDGYFR